MKQLFINILFLLALFTIALGCTSSNNPTSNPDSDPPLGDVKETYFPKSVWNVAENNDYQSTNSQFNNHRMATTNNLVAFWEAGFGSDPNTCANTNYRFPLSDMIQETDKMFVFYRDVLKFVEKGNSLTDKYRMMLYIYYNDDGTLYGGGAEDKVGIAWISPGRVKYAPYGGMAHELGHSFQYMVAADGNWGYSTNPAGSSGQAIWEMTSQYMLWQYYPEWITFENYHLVTFMRNTHKAFMHEDNRYCSPFVLEYWSEKHGLDFVGRLWRESKKGEDPVIAYKRMNNMTQDAFNNEMFDAYRRFITWDMARIREVSKAYANQHTTELNPEGNNWYKISPSKCPENYGYNGIRLNVPNAGTEVTLNFKGIAGANGYRAINIEKAGWRYGFVAVKKNGERVYGDIYSASEGIAKSIVPENCEYLWLVVSGAPTEHWEHVWDEKSDNDEQWSYQIKLTGTTLHDSVIK